jgi:hypothetical protein
MNIELQPELDNKIK